MMDHGNFSSDADPKQERGQPIETPTPYPKQFSQNTPGMSGNDPLNHSSPPSAKEIRRELARILESEEFASVGQLRSFLAYVVDATLDQRAHQLKGYTIATEALGRDPSFDPNTNPIVRVEAARLRRRLAAYYTAHGADDPVTISIPKGTYVPEFEMRAGAYKPEFPGRPDSRSASTANSSSVSEQFGNTAPADSALTKALLSLEPPLFLLASITALALAFAAGWYMSEL